MGHLYIISAPSGTGKTSLISELLETLDDVSLTVSHTTRPMREGEVDGESYHFVSKDDFVAQLKEGDFLEHAEVFGNYYGTSKSQVIESMQQQDVLLEIDWQGALQVKQAYPNAIMIFILPPNIETLKERLEKRAKDSDDVIAGRLAGAKKEIQACPEYDYIVVNDAFEKALEELRAIFLANRLKAAQIIRSDSFPYKDLVNWK